MTKPLRTQFVVADGARARWVVRSEVADDFTTVKELHAHDKAHGGPQGVVFEGSSGQRFSTEERDDAVRAHRSEFDRQVADVINDEVRRGEISRLAIVAPDHALAAIVHGLSGPARAVLAKTLAKDLTKTPDHELIEWLRPLEIG